MTTASSQRPQSATHGVVAATGFASFTAAAVLIWWFQPFGQDVVKSATAMIAATTIAIFLVDLLWQKVHLRASTGLDFAHDDPSWPRTLTKLAGLLATLGFVALGYWLFPEYQRDRFNAYFEFLTIILPPWLLLALPYFHWIDRRMREPHDGYWQMGKLAMLQWDRVDMRAVGQHLLAWIIKGYFLALMFTYLCEDVRALLVFDVRTLGSFKTTHAFLSHFLYFIDLALATLGYIVSFRLTDTHVRSSEPTMLGWVVCIVCYEPFFQLLSRQYLSYRTGYSWDAWLAYRPLLFAVWGSAILVVIAIYMWSTVMFGARFSNLTHRGIITNGPYRWTKHPAYLTKNLFFWMTAVPFMPRGTLDETLSRCLLLLGVNFLYVMRAKTEEWHLSRDPVYVEYALWIEEHGIFRMLRRLPLLRYLAFRPPSRIVSRA